MFGVKKISEAERLRAVYTDQSDGELLRLQEERDGLTDVAREALAEVMQQRGLEVMAQEAARVGEQTKGEHDPLWESLGSDEVPIFTFGDVYPVDDMLRLLDEAHIDCRLSEGSYVHWEGLRSTRRTGITVFVQRSQEELAKACLRQVILAADLNQEQPPALSFTPPSGLVLLLTCERADALGLTYALSAAGISFYWRDGRDDKEVASEEVVAIEVHAAQRDRADLIVQKWMSEAPELENPPTVDG